jgi:glycosyltransferase involved in cell wall biosynthesis
MRTVRPTPLVSTPSVTVVVPCYNYGQYLAQLVEHVRDQPGLSVDILIVDDCSPDGSGDVAESLAAANPAVRVLQHRVNRGHIQTFNDGLREVSSDYVVLLSADDLLSGGALTRAIALMEQFPKIGFVYGYARSFSDELPIVDPRVRSWSVWTGIEWLTVSARKGHSFTASPEVVMRTAAWRAAGDYDPRLPHTADLEILWRIALRWDVGRVNGPIQALYRVHGSNMHLTVYGGMLVDLVERRKAFDILFTEHAADNLRVMPLRASAVRAMATESLRLALIAHRDGAPSSEVRGYIDFAIETDPTVRSTVLWALCRVGPLAGRSLPGVAARRFASKVRHHLNWRHERRYGT